MATLEKQRLLCISCSDTWSGPWKDRHQIMARILLKNQILFIEEPQMSLFSIFRDWKRLRRLWSWLTVRNPQRNLWLYTPILGLPFRQRIQSIHYINNIILLINLRLVMWAIRFRPTIVWTFSHVHGRILKKLGDQLTIYTAHDVWEEFPMHKKLRQVELKYEEETIRNADIIFFTARANRQRKAHLNPNTYYLPHGCPTPPKETIMKKCDDKPSDFPTDGKLFLGYWGVISRKVVDIELLNWLSDRHSEWVFVLIGPVVKPDRKLFNRLAAKSNVVLLGGKRAEEMHDYLFTLDVGLMCYPMEEMRIRSSSPMKVWDYISAGLPVVSIPILEIESLGEFVCFAEGNEQWEQMIVRAAADNAASRKQRRLEFAEQNSWEKRVEQISALLVKHMAYRSFDKT